MELQTLNGNVCESQCQVKVALLGQVLVGKTALMTRFVRGNFYEDSQCTIGSAFLTKTTQIGRTKVKFEIWDTAGSERYNSITPMYYRGSHACLVVYDLTCYDTYSRAKRWVQELKRSVSSDTVIALVGNKFDLSRYRDVCFQRTSQYAKDNGLIFLETSAKTGFNVNEIFHAVGSKFPLIPKNDPRSRPFYILGQQEGESSCCNK